MEIFFYYILPYMKITEETFFNFELNQLIEWSDVDMIFVVICKILIPDNLNLCKGQYVFKVL